MNGSSRCLPDLTRQPQPRFAKLEAQPVVAGTVPDAIILTSSYKYELTQLPEDKGKDLIFYCSNTNCTASDAAAERASASGYENVHIMREGIKGWKDAGKATTPYPQS